MQDIQEAKEADVKKEAHEAINEDAKEAQDIHEEAMKADVHDEAMKAQF